MPIAAKKFCMQSRYRPETFDKLNPEPGPTYNSDIQPTQNFSAAILINSQPKTFLPQPTKNFPKQKDLSRTEQCYVGKTAVKVNTTDTRLDLLIASRITTHFVCNTCRSTAVLTVTSNNQAPSIEWDMVESRYIAVYSMRIEHVW